MNFPIIFIYTFLFSFLIVNSKIPNECPTYKQTSLETKKCLHKSEQLRFLVQSCPQQTKCVIDQSGTHGKCEKFEYEHEQPSFPGGKCQTNSDCLSKNCTNNFTCSGSLLSQQCNSNSDCIFGYTCHNSHCNSPPPENIKCTFTSDCQFPLICYNGKCKSVFKFKDGSSVKPGEELLCQSGKAYEGKCVTLENVNTFCDEQSGFDGICKYKTSKGEEIQINENCQCVFNMDDIKQTRRKCLLGNYNNPYWEKVLELYKETLTPNNTKVCNLDENRPGFCREYLKKNITARKSQMFLEKYLIESDYAGHFPENEKEKETILNTVFGFSSFVPKSETIPTKCPSYIINSKLTFSEEHSLTVEKQICAYAENPFSEDGNGIKVYINPSKCGEGEECNFDQRLVFTNWFYNATCRPKVLSPFREKDNNFLSSKKQKKLLPGEDCTLTEGCLEGAFDDIGKCINAKCTGHGFNETCRRDSDCLIGLYCDDNLLVCQNQKGLGEKCNSHYDCKNNFLCMNKTCLEFYSLPNGTYLEPKKGKYFKSLCKYEFINEKTNQCIDSLEYYNVLPENIDENGFVKCNLNQMCNYTSGGNWTVYTKSCECGYNKEGQGYCPLSHSYQKEEWERFYKHKKKFFDNKCHSLKRYDCVDINMVDNVNFHRRKSEEAHLYNKVDTKVIEVLSANNLTNNKMFIYLMMMLLFI